MVSLELITGIPLFKDVSPDVQKKIAAISEELAFTEGQTIFREGEGANKLHFLIKGSVALRVNIMTKPESVTVSFVAKSYECFGWSGLVAPHFYTASAYCEEDCKIMTVSGSELLQILADDTSAGFLVMYRVASLVSDRLRNSRHALLKTL